jgi:acetyl esterase/lipase
MDLYLPNPPAQDATESTPVIVFFYGGSWNRGEKSEYEFVGRRLASLGYITAIPNYRVYPEAKYPQFLEDGAKASAKVLQLLAKPEYQQYKPDRQLIMMGHSAGAYNAAMLAMDDRWLGQENINRQSSIKGLIGLAGAYNIYPICVQEVRPVFDHPNYPANSQPIDYVASSNVPTLLLTPEVDELVSTKKNSLSLHQALLQNKTSSKVVAIKGTDHITVLGTLSPVLFFKGDSLNPIQNFVQNLKLQPNTTANFNANSGAPSAPPTGVEKGNGTPMNENLHDLTKLPGVEGVISDTAKPIPICKS